MVDEVLLELTVGLLVLVLVCVDPDAGRAEGEQAVFVFAEVEDELFGVEGAALGFVDLFCHRNRT